MQPNRVITTVLALVVVLTAIDVFFDLYFGLSWRHIGIETAIILAAGSGMAWQWRRTISSLRTRIQASEAAGARWRADAERWRNQAAQHLLGLGEAIDRQLEEWGLSRSEQEVALLLLKGLSLREIADIRGVVEKTVRKQCLAIYRKAGLAGRAELAAYFLEDLLLPPNINSQHPGGGQA